MDEKERIRIMNETRMMDEMQKRVYYEQNKKSEVLMMVLSIIIPGLGQLIMREILKGILILLFSWLVIPWLYGIYDAYKTAERYNTELYNLLFGYRAPAPSPYPAGQQQYPPQAQYQAQYQQPPATPAQQPQYPPQQPTENTAQGQNTDEPYRTQ